MNAPLFFALVLVSSGVVSAVFATESGESLVVRITRTSRRLQYILATLMSLRAMRHRAKHWATQGRQDILLSLLRDLVLGHSWSKNVCLSANG
jgi:hypothetical protein